MLMVMVDDLFNQTLARTPSIINPLMPDAFRNVKAVPATQNQDGILRMKKVIIYH
jgi:hypothetical protein